MPNVTKNQDNKRGTILLLLEGPKINYLLMTPRCWHMIANKILNY